MKEKILNYASITMPILLVIVAAWCLFSNDQHFPMLGSMIKKAERQQASLLKKIQQQKLLITEKEPAARELSEIRGKSFSCGEDIVGQMRNRVEQTFNSSGAKIRTIATPRKMKSVPEIELYEITLTAEAKTSEIAIIIQEFSKPPQLLLRSISARPNNMLKPDFLNLNLTFAVAGFNKQKSEEVK